MQLEAISSRSLLLTLVTLLVSQTTYQERREDHQAYSEDFFLQLRFELKLVLLQDTRIAKYCEKEMCLWYPTVKQVPRWLCKERSNASGMIGSTLCCQGVRLIKIRDLHNQLKDSEGKKRYSFLSTGNPSIACK